MKYIRLVEGSVSSDLTVDFWVTVLLDASVFEYGLSPVPVRVEENVCLRPFGYEDQRHGISTSSSLHRGLT